MSSQELFHVDLFHRRSIECEKAANKFTVSLVTWFVDGHGVVRVCMASFH